jgi:hypothetical protein
VQVFEVEATLAFVPQEGQVGGAELNGGSGHGSPFNVGFLGLADLIDLRINTPPFPQRAININPQRVWECGYKDECFQ